MGLKTENVLPAITVLVGILIRFIPCIVARKKSGLKFWLIWCACLCCVFVNLTSPVGILLFVGAIIAATKEKNEKLLPKGGGLGRY